MATINIQNSERQYYIDWLRILLILSVFLFHIGMIFNSWAWHVKNDVMSASGSLLWYIMVFMHEWRMPLLILISGAGTYFALGKRTPWQYLKERFIRLFVPLVIGIFTLVPIQVYIEKSARYDSLLSFYPHMFEGIYPEGNFSWHHLWFIAYLFFIALIISPFLNFFRSGRFDLFIGKIGRIVTKRLGANIFLIPMVLSQIILRPFFPDDTNSLVNDWAAFAYYIIFFLSGYIIMSSKTIVDAIMKQKRMFLAESLIVTILLFTLPRIAHSKETGDIIWDIISYFLAWSCGMTAIGYAKQYLNIDSKIRKLANEAIYPFYLLHQPAIVVFGYFIVQMDIAVFWKVILISLSSFTTIVAIYWLLIRPFNVPRVLFGMKKIRKESHKPVIPWTNQAILAYPNRSTGPFSIKNELNLQNHNDH